MKKRVFLGGSCNPTTWRADVAIPALEAAGVAYFNPQVANWTPECVAQEAEAKADSEVLLFVIDGQTRAIASMIEAAEYAHAGRNTVVVVHQVEEGTVIGGQRIEGGELKDLNRARTYLIDSLGRAPRTWVGEDIHEALAAAIRLIQ